MPSGNIWPKEYADKETTFENGYFVNNGALTSHLALLIVAEVTQDEEIYDYCNIVLAEFETMAEQYRMADGWLFYMLNPKTEIPPHYVIYEARLFDALYALTGYEFYEVEAKFRHDALKKVLAPQVFEINGTREYILNRAAPPHPYMIDVYATTIMFYDKENNLLHTEFNGISDVEGNQERFYEGNFMKGEILGNALRYEVYSSGDNRYYKLFEGDLQQLTEKEQFLYEQKPEIVILGELKGKALTITPTAQDQIESRIVYDIDVEPVDTTKIYALEIENTSNTNHSFAIILQDEDNNACHRYYLPLLPGKNLIIFSSLGFVDIDELNNISKISFRIFTNDMGLNEDYEFNIGELRSFSDNLSFYEYQETSEYYVHPA